MPLRNSCRPRRHRFMRRSTSSLWGEVQAVWLVAGTAVPAVTNFPAPFLPQITQILTDQLDSAELEPNLR